MAVLVHDSQGGCARAAALQLPLTPAVDVTRLLGAAGWGPDWAFGWVKVHGPHGRVHTPTVAPSGQRDPGSVALSMCCGPLQVVEAC